MQAQNAKGGSPEDVRLLIAFHQSGNISPCLQKLTQNSLFWIKIFPG
jgi:hypothetical protein